MDNEVNQVVQAIMIASDPSQSAVHSQALNFLSSVQGNAADTWRLGLALFADCDADGRRKHHPQARFFGLRILEDFLDTKYEPLDAESFITLQQALLSYIQSEYVFGPAEDTAPFLRNKFSHTLTLFFLCTYLQQWPTFFTDLFALLRPPSSEPDFNLHISLLFFHLVLEISEEVADQILKTARSFDPIRHARDSRVRDVVRERDAPGINDAVLTIVADSVEKLRCARSGEVDIPTERLSEVVDWGVRTFGSYVGWIDINLTVTPTTISLLFSLLSDPSLPIRLGTANALLRMVSKGLKEPGDKLQLIKVLSLGEVIESLEHKTRIEQGKRGQDANEGEETYREALGRLLNAVGMELSRLTEDESAPGEIRSEASAMLEQLTPTFLQFLADQYDDTCSTVFPLATAILSSYKKIKRSSQRDIATEKRVFLTSLLNVLLQKMKWDEDSDPEDMDDDDKHAFDTLRKSDLRVHVDSIMFIDQDLVVTTIEALVMSTLAAFKNGISQKWNEIELAIYLIYIFGDINKGGGKGRYAFCQAPAVDKEKRKQINYSEYPLTPHGEMLLSLVDSGVSAYHNPTVAMQFFETCARYGDFFKVRKECIVPLLEVMVDSRGIHHPSPGIRSRVFYLLYKFLREEKGDIPIELVDTLLDKIRDLLAIQVELPEVDDQQDILSEAVSNPGIFDSQLFLFEATGILISLTMRIPERPESLLLSIVTPLLNDLSVIIQNSLSREDTVSVVRVHHIIMALGNVAKGFPDVSPSSSAEYISPPIEVFRQVTRVIIMTLEAMNIYKILRDAARFALARIIATTGSSVTEYIPALMSSLLAHFEPSELVDFMSFIGLLMHKLQREIFDVLDQLISPLTDRIVELLSMPVSGTDDTLTHLEAKKGYVTFLNNVMVNRLHDVFLSERNKVKFPALLQNVVLVAQDTTDPSCQKMALSFFARCISAWGQQHQSIRTPNDNGHVTDLSDASSLPGFDRFVYERLVPLAFDIPFVPGFNVKDGQQLMVLHELSNLLQTVQTVRGNELHDFLLTNFLPMRNWPPELAENFVTKLKELDGKSFRKYFADIIRTSLSVGQH